MLKSLVAGMLLLSAPLSAIAQQPPDPVAEAPIRIGVLGLRPQFAVTDIGIDTNVFNEAVDPKQDFTFTTSPGLELWMRTGRGLFSTQARVNYVYFAEYESERSASSQGFFQYEYRFNRLRPVISYRVLNTSERPGYEIDARVRRLEQSPLVGVELRVGSKTTVQVDYHRQDTSYAADAVFDGQPLDQSLNRKSSAVEISYRHGLTALTTWVMRASGEQERFEFQSDRNSDTFRASAGFELAPLALIRGKAFVGFRSLEAADGGTLPPFRGVIADADVAYTAPSQTRLAFMTRRDIQYSYDLRTPYYVQLEIALTLTQRIIGRWDVQLTAGRDYLDYRSQVRSSTVAGRQDVIERLGGGIGYQTAERVRISFDAASERRESILYERAYRGGRIGASVTYGF